MYLFLNLWLVVSIFGCTQKEALADDKEKRKMMTAIWSRHNRKMSHGDMPKPSPRGGTMGMSIFGNAPKPSSNGRHKDVPFGLWPRIPWGTPMPKPVPVPRTAPPVPRTSPRFDPPTMTPSLMPSDLVTAVWPACTDPINGRSWTLAATLEGASPAPSWWRAVDADIFADTVVLGQLWDSSLTGSVYIFTRDGDGYRQETILRGSRSSAWFGASVSLYEDTLAVGAYGENAVYIYVRQNGEWTQQARLSPDDSVYFGHKLDLFEDHLAVSTEAESGRGSAAKAYIYTRTGTQWVQQEAFDMDSTDLQFYGASTKISGNFALFNVRHVRNAEPKIGVYVYSRQGSRWVLQEKIWNLSIISIDENHLVGYANSRLRVYYKREDNPESTFHQIDELDFSDNPNGTPPDFGYRRAAVDGCNIILSSPGSEAQEGVVQFFRRKGASSNVEFELIAQMTEPSPKALAQFGIVVKLDGDVAVVASRHDDGNAYAHVYTFS